MALNIKKSSLQRIYEFALKHLRKQGGVASDSTGTCLYRAPNGRKCAVGAMLTDEQLQQCGMRNGDSVKNNTHAFEPIVGNDRTGKKMRLLIELQEAHDMASTFDDALFMARFESNMRDVAESMGLTYKPPGASLRT